MATKAKAQEPAEEPEVSKVSLWDALSKTDPAHTKSFSRAGGFKGTAIKPIWIIRRLTELFGPVGVGWGMHEPQFQVVPGENEVMVYCTVACWHTSPNSVFYGVGGDKVVTRRQSGAFHDDEAFKKAFTDAVGNAFKFVGVGADVHMGLFEDSKYVAEVKAEFSGPPANDHNGNGGNGKDAPFPQGPAKNKTELKDLTRVLWREVEGCGDGEELDALLKAKPSIALVAQLIKALPFWWSGGTQTSGEPFEGLESVISRKQREFDGAGDNSWHGNPLNAG